MVNSSAEGTDSWRLDCQVVEVPGLGSGTGVDSAPGSCKSPLRIVRVPVLVGCALPRLIDMGPALRYRNLRQTVVDQEAGCKSLKLRATNRIRKHYRNPRLTRRWNPLFRAEDLGSTGSLVGLWMRLRSPQWKANKTKQTKGKCRFPSKRARYPRPSHMYRH